jgi:hypothetical protein
MAGAGLGGGPAVSSPATKAAFGPSVASACANGAEFAAHSVVMGTDVRKGLIPDFGAADGVDRARRRPPARAPSAARTAF